MYSVSDLQFTVVFLFEYYLLLSDILPGSPLTVWGIWPRCIPSDTYKLALLFLFYSLQYYIHIYNKFNLRYMIVFTQSRLALSSSSLPRSRISLLNTTMATTNMNNYLYLFIVITITRHIPHLLPIMVRPK